MGLTLLTVSSPRSAAQSSQAPEVVVRISTELVQVDAVVTDKQGRHVTDLQAEDFEIEAEGRKRRITHFRYVDLGRSADSRATAAAGAQPAVGPARNPIPTRSMAIVVDDLTLSFESTVRTRNLLNRLVDEQLSPGDLVAILRTGGGMGALQQFTTDKRLLKAAIAGVNRFARRGKVEAAALYRDLTATGEGPAGASSADPGGAALAAAAASLSGLIQNMEREHQLQLALGTLGTLEAVVRALAPLPGRKSLLLLSEGFTRVGARGDTTRVPERLQQLVDTANRASVVVYTLNPAGLQTLLPGAESDSAPTADPAEARRVARELRAGLEEMAQDTGGLAIADTNDLTGAVRQVLEDQEGYYLLGYEPETVADTSPRFHKIAVKVKRPGLRVRSRKGFFATSASWDEPPPPPGIIDTLLSPFAAVDVPLRLTPLFTHDAVRGSSLRCLIHVDARDLTFVEDGEARKVVLEAVAMSFGASSRLIERAGGTYTVRLPAAAAEAARRGGFVVTLDLPVKEAGGHQVRAAVRDVTSGRAGSASQFLDVPDLRKGRLGLSGIVMSGADASPAPQAASGSAAEAPADPDATSAVRRFRGGTKVAYAFGVYNARRETPSAGPKLDLFLNLYREGRRIQTLPAPPVRSSSSGEGPIAIAGAFRLGSAMRPGAYTLEVLVADTLRGRKNAAAVQWIDFEVAE